MVVTWKTCVAMVESTVGGLEAVLVDIALEYDGGCWSLLNVLYEG
jgi:hypothetical protein